jgi:hypothetical protein
MTSCRLQPAGVAPLAVMPPQPVYVVRHGVFDVIVRLEACVLPKPGDVEVIVRRPVGACATRSTLNRR